MAVPLEKAVAILNVKKEDLVQKGLKAYLKERLRELRAEIIPIHLRYKVSSLEELDQKINEGELNENDTFEYFTRLDYLEDEEEKVKELLNSLNED